MRTLLTILLVSLFVGISSAADKQSKYEDSFDTKADTAPIIRTSGSLDADCSCGTGMYNVCNDSGGPIADDATTDFIISVPYDEIITNLRVCWTIHHTFDADLDIVLVSPSGTEIVLSTDNGSNGNDMINTTMCDDADTPITSGLPPFTGAYTPEDPLSSFDGENAFGDWILRVTDDDPLATGSLDFVCLTFNIVRCDCGEEFEHSHCNNVGGPLADDATTNFIIDVPYEYIITDLSVCWTIHHTFDADLDIVLVSPSGTEIVLSTDNGSNGNDMINTTMCDDADTPITSGTAPFTGAFVPEQPLSSFVGENARGDWILRVTDDDPLTTGSLDFVCLTFVIDEILPVELTSFDAVPGNRSVTLDWKTASETDNDHFEIHRNEIVVGHVAASNTSSGDMYSWTESNLVNGREYAYSLHAVDIYGSSEVLGSVSAMPTFTTAAVSEYTLHQNYPNPFNPSTSITFDLVEAGHTRIVVYNSLGQTLATVVDGQMAAGRHSINFNAEALPSGLYFYRMEAGDFTAIKKMILMK